MYRVSATYIAKTGTHFDKEYYLKHHVALAYKQTKGKVNIKRVEVEWDVEEIDWSDTSKSNPENIISPCRFSMILETKKDLSDFFEFFKSPDVEPLRDDVKRYTDCDLVWAVSELLEPGET